MFSFKINFPIVSAVWEGDSGLMASRINRKKKNSLTTIKFCDALPASLIARIRKVNEKDDRDKVRSSQVTGEHSRENSSVLRQHRYTALLFSFLPISNKYYRRGG